MPNSKNAGVIKGFSAVILLMLLAGSCLFNSVPLLVITAFLARFFDEPSVKDTKSDDQ